MRAVRAAYFKNKVYFQQEFRTITFVTKSTEAAHIIFTIMPADFDNFQVVLGHEECNKTAAAHHGKTETFLTEPEDSSSSTAQHHFTQSLTRRVMTTAPPASPIRPKALLEKFLSNCFWECVERKMTALILYKKQTFHDRLSWKLAAVPLANFTSLALSPDE